LEKRRTRGLRWSRLVRGSEPSLRSESRRLGRKTALDATSDLGRSAGKRKDAKAPRRKEPAKVPAVSNRCHRDSHLPRTLRLSEPALCGLRIEKRRTRGLRWSRLVRRLIEILHHFLCVGFGGKEILTGLALGPSGSPDAALVEGPRGGGGGGRIAPGFGRG
jgi:hypothetical protein